MSEQINVLHQLLAGGMSTQQVVMLQKLYRSFLQSVKESIPIKAFLLMNACGQSSSGLGGSSSKTALDETGSER